MREGKGITERCVSMEGRHKKGKKENNGEGRRRDDRELSVDGCGSVNENSSSSIPVSGSSDGEAKYAS